MIYLDSSALLKLIFEEAESSALTGWLTDRAGVPLVSSELAGAEVVRATRRLDPTAVSAARLLVSQIDLVPIGRAVIDQAADVGEVTLRTLDAIHLASALSIGNDLVGFVAYDHRLHRAALQVGLPAEQP